MGEVLKFQPRADEKSQHLNAIMPRVDDLRHLINMATKANGATRGNLLARANHEFDGIIGDMLPERIKPIEDRGVIESIRKHHPLTVEAMAKLPSDIIPLVIVRELVSRYNMPVDHRIVKNWKRFKERYRGVIAA